MFVDFQIISFIYYLLDFEPKVLIKKFERFDGGGWQFRGCIVGF